MEVLHLLVRVAAIHSKGAPTKLKGSRVVAVPRTGEDAGGRLVPQHERPDSGGVDFPAIRNIWCRRTSRMGDPGL
jgi:hypothetical protein